MLSKYNPEGELYHILEEFYMNKKDKQLLGKNLRKTVLEIFSVDNIISCYNQFSIK
jgi:hypothetical protein